MSTTVIIPAYNEEKKIESTIKEATTYADEVIVVDDGSKDQTAEVSERAGARVIRLKKNAGKGNAVRTGMLAAETDVIAFADADGSIDLSYLSVFEKHLDEYDVVVGVKKRSQQSGLRRVLGTTFNAFTSLITGLHISDTQCGFKMFSYHASRTIFLRARTDGFAFDVEALMLAKKFGLKVKAIPIDIRSSDHSSVGIFDPIRMFWDVLKIRLTLWRVNRI